MIWDGQNNLLNESVIELHEEYNISVSLWVPQNFSLISKERMDNIPLAIQRLNIEIWISYPDLI